MTSEDNPEEVPKVSWVYKLNKADLVARLQELGQDSEGTVEELRARLVKLVRSLANRGTAESINAMEDTEVEERSRTTSPATVCETVRKWNAHFDGKSDPVSFLERIEELRAGYNIPEDRLLTALPELLLESPLEWLRNNRDDWQT